MTDKVESDKAESAQREPNPEEQASSSELHSESQDALVTVELPIDVVAALSQLSHELGQTQNQVILEALRSTLGIGGIGAKPPEPASEPIHQTSPRSISSPSSSFASSSPTSPPLPEVTPLQVAHLQTELERLNARLTQLETLIPKVAELEGKSIAF